MASGEADDARRQPRYSDLAIETALTVGLVFGLRLRQTEGLLISVLELIGLDLAVPDHTTLSRRARTWQSPEGRLGRRIPGEGPVTSSSTAPGFKFTVPASGWRKSTVPGRGGMAKAASGAGRRQR